MLNISGDSISTTVAGRGDIKFVLSIYYSNETLNHSTRRDVMEIEEMVDALKDQLTPDLIRGAGSTTLKEGILNLEINDIPKVIAKNIAELNPSTTHVLVDMFTNVRGAFLRVKPAEPNPENLVVITFPVHI